MFSLLMGFEAATGMGGDRVFEYTDEDSARFFAPAVPAGLSRLVSLPALVLPELQQAEPGYARLGHVTDLRPRLNLRPQVNVTEWQYRFVADPAFAPIPLELIREHAAELGIEKYEGNRTHWAIKPVDLYAALAEMGAASPLRPAVFDLPTHQPRDPDLLAVMMPFAGFDAVYEALKGAAADVGMRCVRADDIWTHEHILDDVLSLIWRAGIVVADFTGRNANVFYETGITHTIGRRLVPITQTMVDVPFDLQSIRALVYHDNGEGRGKLRTQLADRLRTLRDAS